MNARQLLWVFAALFAWFASSPSYAAPSKFALVIGNESYSALDTLPEATRNARQLADALTQAGFSGSDGHAVAASLDLQGQNFANAIYAFRDALQHAPDGSVGVLYFAGHGLARERRGDVYLLPTDADPRTANLNQIGVPLADILQVLRATPNRTVVVIVDACRNVVSDEGQTVTGQRGGGAGWNSDTGGVGLLRGGHRVNAANEQQQGADYFVAFSTSPDRGAYDSELFSSILTQEINRGADLLTLFKRVGERMAAEAPTTQRQLPTYEVGIYSTPPCFGVCHGEVDPSRFYDCPGCPWMRVVNGGSFQLGSPASEAGRGSDEPVAQTATLAHNFAISEYEVTRAEWKACEHAGACRVLTNRNTWMSDHTPIGGVTATDANAYVTWLSATSHVRYRVPTDQEWEYAARAHTQTPFYFGAGIEPNEANYDYSASYQGSRRAEYRGTPESVGAFDPNGFGLYDMLGNMWEWTEACPAEQSACSSWVLRGGSFKSEPGELRVANRFVIRPDNAREDVGLRVVRDVGNAS